MKNSRLAAFGSGGIVQENPSTNTDALTSVMVDTSGMYLAGYDGVQGASDSEWRIEKRGLSDGLLIAGFGSGGVVQENPSPSNSDLLLNAVLDSTGLYAVGDDTTLPPHSFDWHMEKRNLTDGSTIWVQSEHASAGADGAGGVAVDGAGMYVVGSDKVPGNDEWRVEKRNPGLPGLRVVGIPVSQGWNLISLPVVPVSSAPKIALATVMVAGNVTMVWSYTGAPTPTWKSFNPALTSGNTLTSITDGMGLWVMMTASGTVYVEGYVIPPAGSPPQYSLVKGWNLLGFKPQPDPSMQETLGTYLTGLPVNSYVSSSVFIYDNANAVWVRANPGTFLDPGQALWIDMLTPARLNP